MAESTLYVRRFAAVTGVLLGLLSVFNLSVDAYGMFRNKRLPHLSTDPIIWSRVSAAERAAERCDVVLMGSSRVMHGFGADVPNWGKMKVCNTAVGGTSIAEQRDILDWVLKQRSVRFVVFYLDFHTFNEARGANGDFAQSRFNDERTRLTYFLWGLTSWDAAKASFRALGHPLPYVDTQSQPLSQTHANRIELFRFFKNPHLYTGWTGDPETMETLASMLADTNRARMRSMVVIPPVHAMLLETEHLTGTWEMNQAWKKELVHLLDKRFKGRIPLWDFSTYHPYATEEMPLSPGDPPVPWWIDVSHQSAQQGWMSMARIIFDESPDAVRATGIPGVGEWDPRFGVRLTPDNIDAHLAQADADHAAWVAEHPEQIAWMLSWARELEAMPEAEYDPANDALQPGEFVPELPGDPGGGQQIQRAGRLE
jgi:hypothetical protein